MDVARDTAYETFGRRHWKWFVFGPVAAKTVGWGVAAAGLLLGGVWAWRHAPGFVVWVATWLAPIVACAVGSAVVLVVSLVVWRMQGWWFKMYGVSLSVYSLSIATLSVMVAGLVIGVSL